MAKRMPVSIVITDREGPRLSVVLYLQSESQKYLTIYRKICHYEFLAPTLLETMSESSLDLPDEPSIMPDLIDQVQFDSDAEDDVEDRLQRAVDTINNSPLDRNGQPTLKIRAAARLFHVKRGTLTSRLNGIKSRAEAHAKYRTLSDAEEQVLSEWANVLGHRGFPVTHDLLAEYASVCWLYHDVIIN